jgi:hypothetical protein
MKYLKLFENFGDDIKNASPYKVGDYVRYYDKHNDVGDYEDHGKIIELFIRKNILCYEVEDVEGKHIGRHISVTASDIYRKLIEKEIEDINIKNTTNKFNL